MTNDEFWDAIVAHAGTYRRRRRPEDTEDHAPVLATRMNIRKDMPLPRKPVVVSVKRKVEENVITYDPKTGVKKKKVKVREFEDYAPDYEADGAHRGGTGRVRPGYWLVMEKDGGCYVMHGPKFERQFEEVR